MHIVKRRCRKISRPQKAALLEFIKENPMLLCKKFDKNFRRIDAKNLWEKLARHIHRFPGARKNWAQWRKVWQDLRRKVFHNDKTIDRLTREVNASVKMEQNEDPISMNTFDDEDSQSSQSNPDIHFAHVNTEDKPSLRDFISNGPNPPVVTIPRQYERNISPIVKLAEELMKNFREQVKAEEEYRKNHLKLIREQTDAIKSIEKRLERLERLEQ